MEILFHCLTWGHSSLGPLQFSHQPRLDWTGGHLVGLLHRAYRSSTRGQTCLPPSSPLTAQACCHLQKVPEDAAMVAAGGAQKRGGQAGLWSSLTHLQLKAIPGTIRRQRWTLWTLPSTWIITWTGPKTLTAVHRFLI